ncbi:MAG: polyisoprenoid-binding protein [Gammaproteobacteria bacterium]|nr:polyisoprenoid-binding protein [Gammaproteobacteria bacterium]MDE2262118.1 polyisoprenoid-binding protein [Gammaproteobacteria bacterium]
MSLSKLALPAVLLAAYAGAALAKPVTFACDPAHTHPSFAADHFGGLSVWRGIFTRSSCNIVLDEEAHAGTVDVTVDTSSVDFGVPKLDEHAQTKDLFDVAKYPTATYKGRLADFVNGKPTKVVGNFTLHGVTRPLTLTIRTFECKDVPMMHQYRCGADAEGHFQRDRYGMDFGKAFGFQMWVRLKIQVEAVRQG